MSNESSCINTRGYSLDYSHNQGQKQLTWLLNLFKKWKTITKRELLSVSSLHWLWENIQVCFPVRQMYDGTICLLILTPEHTTVNMWERRGNHSCWVDFWNCLSDIPSRFLGTWSSRSDRKHENTSPAHQKVFLCARETLKFFFSPCPFRGSVGFKQHLKNWTAMSFAINHDPQFHVGTIFFIEDERLAN